MRAMAATTSGEEQTPLGRLSQRSRGLAPAAQPRTEGGGGWLLGGGGE